VQWSPKHPAVFASCDNGGHVNIWNINQNKESPVVRGLPHLKTSQNEDKDKPKPLNCLRWNSDGRRLITGDSMGFVTLMQVHQDLATPHEEDFKSIVKLIDMEERR
jgi:dynein intermediate chain